MIRWLSAKSFLIVLRHQPRLASAQDTSKKDIASIQFICQTLYYYASLLPATLPHSITLSSLNLTAVNTMPIFLRLSKTPAGQAGMAPKECLWHRAALAKHFAIVFLIDFSHLTSHISVLTFQISISPLK